TQPARAHRRDRVVATDLAPLLAVALGDGLQIRAGAERAARAGEHRNRGVRVGIEGEERIVQLARGRTVDGVATMRPVDGDDGDGAVALDQYGIWFGHDGPPSLSSLRAKAKQSRSFPRR